MAKTENFLTRFIEWFVALNDRHEWLIYALFIGQMVLIAVMIWLSISFRF